MTPEQRAADVFEELRFKPPEQWQEVIAAAIREAEEDRDDRWQTAVGKSLEAAEDLARAEKRP